MNEAAVVVDANVAVKFLVNEPGWEAAERIFAASGLARIAPDAALLEIANVLSRKVRLGEIGRAQADAAMAALPQLFSRLISGGDLFQAAYRLSVDHSHPVYDTVYLALAEQENTLLVTGDLKFIARFQATALASRFVAIGDASSLITPASPPASRSS